MLRRSWIAAVALCAAIALPGVAAAQTVAYAAGGGYTNLRAGPSTSYPVIARVYPGTRVDVLGCLETRAWCDVIVEDIRGWIYARRLEFLYSGRRYLVPDYYSYFDAPYVVFRFGDRDRHRRDRDRYRRDRDEYNKPMFGHPGGGGPGPVDGPGYGGDPSPNEDYFGHPGGGGPGPETVDGGIITEEVPGPEGSGGGGPGGLCAPGDPSCVEGTQ